jgi:hypothetical protein
MGTEHPRARRDLLTSRQSHAGRDYVVVKDPGSRRYFRLRPPEWWLVEQMDGTRSPAELALRFRERFGAELSVASLVAFVDRLRALHVLEGAASEKASTALSQRQADERGLRRLLFVRLKAIDPDDWLGVWAHRLRHCLRPWIWPATGLFIAGALWIIAGHRAAFQFDLGSILQVSSLPLLVLTIFLIVSLHEIAHGLVCRHFGGHVHEMGFLLLYFQPCLYCDLSDAWLFGEKWKKLLVTFSGAYFQIVLGALGVWGWRVAEPGTWVSQMFWLLAVVSLFNVLFNFNPLIKLDGYYMLSDGLGIPNLRTRAFGWLAHMLMGHAWPYAELPGRRERRIYWSYGLGASLYSVFLIGYIVYLTLGFAVSRWGGPGLLLYIVLAAFMLRAPLGRAVRAIVPAALYNVRKTILWVLAGLALLAAVLLPFDHRVGSPARIEPWAQMTISVLPDGYMVTEWYEHGQAELRRSKISKLVASGFTTLQLLPLVRVGDTIAVGDTVLRITADQFSSLHEEAKADLRAKQAELDLLLSGPKPEETAEIRAQIQEEQSLLHQRQQDLDRTRSLFDRSMVPKSTLELAETAVRTQEARLESARQRLALIEAPPKAEAVDKLEAEIEKLSRQEVFYGGQLEATAFVSPVSGQVLRLATRDGEVCRIARTDSLRCVLDVDEADWALLAPDQKVTLKIRSAPFASFEGRLVRVSGVGDTASSASTFPAVAAVVNPGGLSPGMSGYAKVTTGRRTLVWRLARSVVRFIRIEFWSWW